MKKKGGEKETLDCSPAVWLSQDLRSLKKKSMETSLFGWEGEGGSGSLRVGFDL